MSAIDMISATSDGAIAMLTAAIDDDVAEVTTNPDQIDPTDTTERQFVIIGDIDSDNEGGKGEQLELITFQIVVVYRGRQRWKMHVLMHLVRIAIEGIAPQATGAVFQPARWLGAKSSPQGADGITHAGIVEFEVYAQAA